MNTPHSFSLLNEYGTSITTAGNHYLAAHGDAATPLLVGIVSSAVAIALAVTGWKLKRHWRRRDNQRADLTDLAQVVRNVHVQLQLLADQDSMATGNDCRALRTLKYELGGADGAFTPALASAVRRLVMSLDAVLATALPITAGAGPATLAQARTQGRAVQDALAATAAALQMIGRLRSR